MMGYDSGGASQDSHDEDDDGEYDEAGSGNRFLGFMFGNVDNSGDLDVDYLDEDAKEHLAALADKLGPSLADIDLSVKSPKPSAEAAEEDYDEKAEDAVDYEDIEEQYEGPEVQAATEEDNLLREKEYLSAQVHVTYLHDQSSVFDDDNYDEEEEEAEEIEVREKSLDEAPALEGKQSACTEKLHEGDIPSSQEEYNVSQSCESPAACFEEMQESDESWEELCNEKTATPLPVLCVENDKVILRFSEIFGIHEFPRRKFKRDSEPVIYKERVKTLDASEVEEDEEAYLRGFSQGIVQEHPTYYDVSGVVDSRNFNKYSSNPGGDWSPVVSDELQDDDFCGGPLKESPIELSSSWKLPSSPNFYPLDQQDWENFIVWDASPGSPDEPTKHLAEDIGTGVNHANANGIVESKEAEEPIDPDAYGTILHPQLLRLESRLPVNSYAVRSQESSEMQVRDYTAMQFGKLSLESNHLLEESWEHEIIWEPKKYARRPKLILDLQDRKMLFEILNEKETSNFWVHAEAMIITRASNSDIRDSVELSNHAVQSNWQFDIGNDMFYSNRKRTQQLNTNSEKRTAYGVEVFHSAPAIKLDTMKLKLSNKDIANFHRPKALWYPHDNEVAVKEQEKLPTLGPMKIIIKSLGGKGSRLHVDAEETVASIKAKGSKKLDFKLSETVKLFYRGNELEDDKSLAMQNVQPNSLLHVVRTNVHLLPRAQKKPSENKSLRPPGAFKKKSDLSVKDGHVFLMEYCEERPLLLSNVGMGARLCTYYQKTNPSDQNGSLLRAENKILGSLIPLDSSDKSPFLGDIKAGSTQSSLETNMYRSPVFPHKVSGTDYLLVRSAKGKLSIRRIDKINVVGQQEPLLEVMSPGTKDLQSYLLKRVLVYMFRQFRELKKRGLPPCVQAVELALQFPNLSEPFLRNRLKKHASAELKRGSYGQWIWKMRPNFHIPSEEALRKLIPPEKVCAYESMQAGLYRLKHLGITRLVHPTGISSALSQLPNEAIALAAASHIERELQITPWNLSSNFVACTNQVRENLERLEISGVGDPSGRGLGFSYVRTAPKATMGNALTKKKAAAGRGGSTVTGTDADLRRLSMDAAREVLLKFNVPEEVIAKQTRWHRIAMIRELSSEQAASGVQVDPSTISKYARGQRMSFVQMQQQTREKCQEIWDRQVQSLTNIDGDEVASDSESNSDLDSFAGDLENLLDAEEGEGDKVNDHRNDRPDGVKGLKMRRHSSLAEAEEKVEDEAAEAAELCRMLMDDDDTNLMRKAKVLPIRKEIGPILRSQAAFGHDKGEPVKKPKKIVKPVTTALYNDVSQEDILSDQTEMEALIARDHFPLKVKAKKLKILGDGLMTTPIFTEKKSARESFVCGACGQLGHMRTNKNCPRYGEDPDALVDAIDRDKLPGKLSTIDPASQSQQKPVMKKIIPKGPTRIAVVEATEDPTSKPSTKVQKIVISSKMKPADGQHEPYKPSIVIRPPIDSDKVSVETPRTSIVFRSMGDTERAQGEVNKPSILIKPPADSEREQPQKKIIIRRPKEVIDLDLGSQDGGVDYDFRKTKKIVELSDLGSYRKQHIYSAETSLKKKSRGDKRWWEEEEKKRTMERLREERTNRYYMEEMRQLEERERIAEIERYEVSLRREREEEERQKAKKKKKKMKKFHPGDDYLEDYRGRRNDTWTMERDRPTRRRPVESVSLSAEYAAAAPAKRRRGGEVGLSNILEGIVETLKSRQEVSYLFLKPVPKKEAPDYLDIIDKPMDLSTIREKVRRMEYKNREDFRHDVWQITFNAHKYNDGRNPGIPPLADQLLELCDYLLNENDESLTEAEEGIGY